MSLFPSDQHPNCKKCGLYLEGCLSPFLQGSGAKRPEIYIVGEASGAHEDLDKILFHPDGASGKLLRAILKDNGIDTKVIRFDNAVSCRPPRNRTPTSKEIKLCAEFLRERIRKAKPKYLLALGGKALECLSAGQSKRMTLKANRRRVVDYPIDENNTVPLIAGYHPSYAVRDKNNLEAVRKDIRFFAECYRGEQRRDTRTYLLGENDCRFDPNMTAKKFSEFVENARKHKRIVATDFETNSIQPHLHQDFRVTAIGLSDITPDGKGNSICMQLDTADRMCSDMKKLRAVRSFLKDETIPKVAHHAKYEMHVSQVRFGVQLRGLVACTLVLHSSVYPMNIDRDLTSVMNQLLGLDPYDTDVKALTGSDDMEERSDQWLRVPWEKLSAYCAMDCAATALCYHKLWDEAKAEDKRILRRVRYGYPLTQLFRHLMMPALHVLRTMERNGMLVDIEYSRSLEDTLCKRMVEIKEKCRQDIPYVKQYEMDKIEELFASDKAPKTDSGRESAKANKKFNPGSTDQCGELIFGDAYFAVECPREWHTDSGKYSVTKEILEILEEENEGLPITTFIKMKREYEGAKKDVGTYVTGVLKRTSPKDNRIRSNFSQSVTSTGRLSSRNPNLQNIKDSKELKRMYIVPNGYTLLVADYSQMELRVLAAVSEDEGFMEAFKLGRDIHEEAARRLFGVGEEQKVTSQQRRLAKTVNFGIAYGISPHGLARSAGIMYDEAEDLINGFYETFTGVAEWQEGIKTFAVRYGCVYTLFGRKRILGNCKIRPRTREEAQLRAAAFRQAINMPIQGTASDMCLTAMVRLEKYIDDKEIEEDIRIINNVHDSILFEIRTDRIEGLTDVIKKTMIEEPMRWVGKWFQDVPIEVDIKTGKSWGDL